MNDPSEILRPKNTARQWERFASLYNKNFLIYFVAQIISNIGSWVYIIAENFLILELTKSGFALGITVGLQWGPMVCFGIYGGLIADKIDKKTLLIVTQSGIGIISILLGFLVALEATNIWIIWFGTLLGGIINCFKIPAMQSFPKELVGDAYLANAIALNGSIAAAGRMIGPAIGGGLILWFGAAGGFAFNALASLIVIVALAFLSKGRRAFASTQEKQSNQITAAIKYIRSDPMLLNTAIIMTMVFALVYNFQVLLPLVAADLKNGNNSTYGLLMSALGAGNFIGSLALAKRARTNDLTLAIYVVGLAFVIVLLAFVDTQAQGLWVSFALGLASSGFNIVVTIRLQLGARDEMLGRVMAIYSIAYLGTGLVSGPAIGALIGWAGLRPTLWGVGGSCGLIALAIWRFSIRKKAF